MLIDEALTTLGVKVPDLLDYTDDGAFIDFNKDLDPQLVNLIGFSSEEYDYLVQTVNSVRQRR